MRRRVAVLVVLLELLLLVLHPVVHRERYRGAPPGSAALVVAHQVGGHCPICRVARHRALPPVTSILTVAPLFLPSALPAGPSNIGSIRRVSTSEHPRPPPYPAEVTVGA